jgi:ribosome biogenesis protein NSA1
MPRVIPPENLGCPPFRALTFDSLGLIKVTEARGQERGIPTVVNTWGEMNASRSVLAASIDDRLRNPLLAVARKDGNVEVINPCNGDLHFSYSVFGDDGCSPEDNEISALHLFRKKIDDQTERSCTLLTCTKKGDVSLRSVKFPDAHGNSTDDASPKTWKACGSGEILVGKVDGSENFSLFGGKRVEANIWDLEQCTKIWSAKCPPKNNLGIFTPTWFTSATFLSKDDHRKFVTGTKSHQVNISSFFCQFEVCPDHSQLACAGDRSVFMTFLLNVDRSCPLISVRPLLHQLRKTQTVILSMSGMLLLT